MSTTASAAAHGRLFQGDGLPHAIICGASSIKGRRPNQEDVLMIHTDNNSGPVSCTGDGAVTKGGHKGWSMVGVFDGHGGKRCSKFAGQNMPENVLVALQELNQTGSGAGSQANNEAIAQALKLAYRMTHEDFARMARGDSDSIRPKTRQRVQLAMDKNKSLSDSSLPTTPKRSLGGEDNSLVAVRNRMIQQRIAMGPRVWDDGSTAICCFVNSNRVFVANVGDSRAVGSIGGKTIALSQDHKPNLPLEKARVHAAGGTVTSMMGCYRVMGMLAMSRALGDVMIEQYLSQEPDVTEQQLGERDFIVMASDGLWDVITSQEAVAIVTQEFVKNGWSPDMNLSAISQRLCTESFRRGSMDNITVAIVLCVSQNSGGDPVQPPSKPRLGAGSGRSLLRQGNSFGSYASDSPSHAGGFEPPSPANRMPLGARGENTIAADLWGGGAVGRLGPGKAQRDALGAGGGITKTLLPAGARARMSDMMSGGGRAAKANSLHSSFNERQSASKSSLPGMGGYGVAAAWGKDGAKNFRQMPVSKRAEILAGGGMGGSMRGYY